MDMRLKGKRALVTGGSGGIGSAIAQLLCDEGCVVVVHGREDVKTSGVIATLRASGGEAHMALGDLSTEAGCKLVGDQVMKATGGVDILVNNAGHKASEVNVPWLDIPWSEWLESYEVNVGASVRLIQQFVPGMKERGWGRIIQISSTSATQPEPGMGDYQASKAAVNNLTLSLTRSLAHTGITVNIVSPGMIATPTMVSWAKGLLGSDDWTEVEKRLVREIIPISTEHVGTPEDIASVVVLLASPRSDYVTGANYRVDGGQCRTVN